MSSTRIRIRKVRTKARTEVVRCIKSKGGGEQSKAGEIGFKMQLIIILFVSFVVARPGKGLSRVVVGQKNHFPGMIDMGHKPCAIGIPY